ncbi:type II toxin-antitoxin system YafQ family toxin [Patescibacteria group bacterium]|nr:type II toxin-antitoxin system YafQ family toxin [Patescibacteria group bacterium]
MFTLSASKKFQKRLKRFSKQDPKLKTRVSKTLLLLTKNPKHPSLRFHKLAGRNTWSVAVTMSMRVIIRIKGKRIYLLRIGSHDEVY